MEIRTLCANDRSDLLKLLDGWELPDGWRGRDFFARTLDRDPTFEFENLWVAADGDTLHGCVQIFPRRLRVLGHAVPSGGIGTVFTRFESRGSGIATALLERAFAAMEDQGMELSILFAERTAFYERRGWRLWPGHRTVLRKNPKASKGSSPTATEVSPFDRARDLDAVRAIHSAYSAPRSGTVVRDEPLWDASLELAGNPEEEFLVARCEGSIVAYARATLLNEVFTVTELARLEEGAGALAAVMGALLTPRDDDTLTPPGKSSAELRSFALVPSFDDLLFTVALENDGIIAHPMEDRGAMLRCLNVQSLAARLDVSLFPDEDGPAFLTRILPPDQFVFWPADRF